MMHHMATDMDPTHLEPKMSSKHLGDDPGHFWELLIFGPKWSFWRSKSRVLGWFEPISDPYGWRIESHIASSG